MHNRIQRHEPGGLARAQPASELCRRALAGAILRRSLSVLVSAMLVVSSVGVALPAVADATVTDLRIAARALGFMEDPPSGTVRVGIVYPTDAMPARREAERLQALFGGSLRAGNIVLRPVMVEAGDVDTADVDVFFVPERVAAGEIGLPHASASRKIPCVTADIAQVEAGACTIGVRSSPKIEVFVNRRAANASGTAFATAFRVMINEL